MEKETTNEKNNFFEPKVKAAFTYIIPPLIGLYILITEKENKFVRFHGYQSIIFSVVAYGVYLFSKISFPTLLGFPTDILVSRSAIFMSIILVLKAYAEDEFELPVIGKIAKDQSRK